MVGWPILRPDLAYKEFDLSSDTSLKLGLWLADNGIGRSWQDVSTQQAPVYAEPYTEPLKGGLTEGQS